MLKDDLSTLIDGEVLDDEKTLTEHEHDASLLRVRPKVVVFPKGSEDIQKVVRYVSEHKKEDPTLSVTARAAGSDMTGGPLNESIIIDTTEHFKKEKVDVEKLEAIVEPGVFYRDFELDTLPSHITFPVYPASKQLAALGGMIMNNSAGERTLRYGQTRNFVKELKMILSDGHEYLVKPLTLDELRTKIALNKFEGELYRRIYELVDMHYDLIKSAKPQVSKNSSGYALWDVYDKEKGVFDLTQLFVGSQGTLGIMTEAKIRLQKEKPHKKMIVAFFKNWNDLPHLVNEVLPFEPESMETFDDATLKLGIRFMPEIAKKVHTSLIRFASKFIPEVWVGMKMLGLPKLIVLIELAEENEVVLASKVKAVEERLKTFKGIQTRTLRDEAEAEKYWVMRRESFNLLRQHVHGKRTAPFIEDFCIAPEKMPEFLPKLLAILKKHKIVANIAGHAGNGNYHIIPLMDLTQEEEREKITPVSEEVFSLIKEYGGSITAEHNDGIIRTPYVEQMFGSEVYALFKEVKQICDPLNIFNPGKKVGGSKAYTDAHIAKE